MLQPRLTLLQPHPGWMLPFAWADQSMHGLLSQCMYVKGMLSCPRTQAVMLCMTVQRRPDVVSSSGILALVIRPRPPVIHSISSHVAVQQMLLHVVLRQQCRAHLVEAIATQRSNSRPSVSSLLPMSAGNMAGAEHAVTARASSRLSATLWRCIAP